MKFSFDYLGMASHVHLHSRPTDTYEGVIDNIHIRWTADAITYLPNYSTLLKVDKPMLKIGTEQKAFDSIKRPGDTDVKIL